VTVSKTKKERETKREREKVKRRKKEQYFRELGRVGVKHVHHLLLHGRLGVDPDVEIEKDVVHELAVEHICKAERRHVCIVAEAVPLFLWL
jgi:hypothetical protein